MSDLSPGTWVSWADPKRGRDPLGVVSANPASDDTMVLVNVRFGPAREFKRTELVAR